MRDGIAGAGALLLCLLAVPVRAATPPPPIEKATVVAAAAAEVWRAFTTAEGARTFFAPQAKIVLALGGAYELYFDPAAPAGARGSEGMRVLSFAPERMLSFSWNAPPKFPKLRHGQDQTWVVVLLEPEGARRTRVRLLHLGWRSGGDWPAARAYFDRAWGLVLGRLARRFQRGPVDWIKE